MTASSLAAADADGRARGGLLWPTLGCMLAVLILSGLGTWQLRRLAWKTALLNTIEQRTTQPPVPLPPSADWQHLDAADFAYRHVVLTGTFSHDKEARVFRPLEEPHGRYSGLGDLILTPFSLASGGTVIVNRGFVPDDRLDPATRAAGQVAGEVTITGLMREPESRNAFTPDDQPQDRIWFTRDPASIAAALGLGGVAPFTVDQDATALPGGLPQGGETVLVVPNNHLSYALTWFGLAVAVVAVYGTALWRRRSGSARAA